MHFRRKKKKMNEQTNERTDEQKDITIAYSPRLHFVWRGLKMTAVATRQHLFCRLLDTVSSRQQLQSKVPMCRTQCHALRTNLSIIPSGVGERQGIGRKARVWPWIRHSTVVRLVVGRTTGRMTTGSLCEQKKTRVLSVMTNNQLLLIIIIMTVIVTSSPCTRANLYTPITRINNKKSLTNKHLHANAKLI